VGTLSYSVLSVETYFLVSWSSAELRRWAAGGQQPWQLLRIRRRLAAAAWSRRYINKADAEKTSAKWRARQCDQFFRPPTAKTQCLGLLFVFFSPTAVASARVQQANASRRGGVCCQAALEWAMRAVWLSSLTPHRADVTRWERNRSHKQRRRRRRPLRSIQSL